MLFSQCTDARSVPENLFLELKFPYFRTCHFQFKKGAWEKVFSPQDCVWWYSVQTTRNLAVRLSLLFGLQLCRAEKHLLIVTFH